jgi:FKBP-type peptidyl-prolyl cis-trans isomerase
MKHSMKKYVLAFLGLVLASSLYARGVLDVETDQKKTDMSYAYGLIIGTDLKGAGLDIDYPALTQGLRDAFDGGSARLSVDAAVSLVQEYLFELREQQAAENEIKETQFFEENGARPGVLSTKSGLQYEVIQSVGGEKPGPQAIVQVHYEGKLPDGTVFDSSYDRGEAADIPLEQVIPGWSEGLQLMGVGDTYTLYIPSALGYGVEGAADVIPPNSPLIFKVELLEILR